MILRLSHQIIRTALWGLLEHLVRPKSLSRSQLIRPRSVNIAMIILLVVFWTQLVAIQVSHLVLSITLSVDFATVFSTFEAIWVVMLSVETSVSSCIYVEPSGSLLKMISVAFSDQCQRRVTWPLYGAGSRETCIHTYVRTHIHTNAYIHRYIETKRETKIVIYLGPSIYQSIHPSTRTCVHTYWNRYHSTYLPICISTYIQIWHMMNNGDLFMVMGPQRIIGHWILQFVHGDGSRGNHPTPKNETWRINTEKAKCEI